MTRHEGTQPTVIAVCGKGGVGKTSVSAVMTGLLAANPDKRVLAIDADPAVGLAGALGMHCRRTVDDVRNRLIARIKNGAPGDREEIAAHLDYEVLEALEERENIAFLAIGRPEQDGCYCQVNQFLKEIITGLSAAFDYVVIDGEAGLEQINRRVMAAVTHLLLVSDASARGLNVAGTIRKVAEKTIAFTESGLILNRVRNGAEASCVRIPPVLTLLGWLPEDDSVRDFDIAGQSLLALCDSPLGKALRAALGHMGIDTGKGTINEF